MNLSNRKKIGLSRSISKSFIPPKSKIDLKNWTPDLAGNFFNTLPDFTSSINDRVIDNSESEAFYEPLKEHEYKSSLPIEILPNNSENRIKPVTEEEILNMQKKIVSVVKSTTGITLLPSVDCGKVGLNSITYTFDKKDGEVIPVNRVEKVMKDVGLVVKRSPVMLNIGEDITFDVPLKPEERQYAPIKPLLQETHKKTSSKVTYLFGRTQSGKPYEIPVEEAKHLLVAGATGGGKTVQMHTIIAGIIFRYTPSEVKLVLADNKGFEFTAYDGLPHLWQKVATTSEGISNLIENLSVELKKRKAIVKNNQPANFPIIITILDEFYDTGFNMNKLVRLIAEARALKMYFILATQHPVANVISTEIKANLVTSVAFKTKNKSGSRLIIGESDAVNLLRNGDSFVRSDEGIIRVQAGLTTTPNLEEGVNLDGEPRSDVEAIMKFIRSLKNENRT